MNLNNQHLKAIQTTKNHYKNLIATETDKEKISVYKAMIEDLTEEEEKILSEENVLLDEFEKGE